MEEIEVAVVGGGPAGLRAAEVAAGMGRRVVVFDGKPSVGRKFLVAGKGGLNLTHGEDFGDFVERYSGGGDWHGMLSDFDNKALREWCEGLGLETFQASSGRVYPKALKGAPVLRAWISRLKEMGVEIRARHLWEEFLPGNVLRFGNGAEVRAKAVVFALGGGSWPKTGSDGGWVRKFLEMGISCDELRASNCGWECDWPQEVIDAAEGLPIKNISASAGGKVVSGELMMTRYGLEGGIIYALGRELRAMEKPVIKIDLKPTFSKEDLMRKLGQGHGNLLERATRCWKLSVPAAAILAMKNYESAEEIAAEVKTCAIPLKGTRPIEEAISSAGGVCWDELDENLMLKKFPGVFVCGEMISWDAPTGGYLLQGAFSSGTRAGATSGR
ncbi:MAG: TIGR03862 family flavoprotein, partial [Akkermansiaceae bacterium]|nr:TIGR03862 family flavoprotein [Akkermansiaceae bacterium]MDP4647721.1 TIGR03862 family flavoprotein [Akkermansiaceae bacterium]MDP4722218.1 TIGR03862 family flavoprotein [Akkermansiaceae bacterium]MDP4780259.1 TIGR03862 family flavoprotein [Akkermansiaceae bacterium]MDP4846258.1 TIGR03862 family flavoprotein [Akkermansiaceae bacterium]